MPEADLEAFTATHSQLVVSGITITPVHRFCFKSETPPETIRIELRFGRDLTLRKERDFYRFCMAAEDSPITYGFNVTEFRKNDDGTWSGKVAADERVFVDDVFKAAFQGAVGGGAPNYKEMAPSALAPIDLAIVLNASAIASVEAFELSLTLNWEG